MHIQNWWNGWVGTNNWQNGFSRFIGQIVSLWCNHISTRNQPSTITIWTSLNLQQPIVYIVVYGSASPYFKGNRQIETDLGGGTDQPTLQSNWNHPQYHRPTCQHPKRHHLWWFRNSSAHPDHPYGQIIPQRVGPSLSQHPAHVGLSPPSNNLAINATVLRRPHRVQQLIRGLLW